MTDETPRYSIAELSDLAGVTPRTVRYYIAQGLLAGVAQPGPGAKYGESHLARLRLVRRLQREHLPLAEIRRRLEPLADEDVLRLVQTEANEGPAQPMPESALDYVRQVLAAGRKPLPGAAPLAAAMAPPPPSTPSRRFLESPAPFALQAAEPTPTPPTVERSQWERISLGPDVELHVRRPLDRRLGRRIDRLVSIARDLLQED